MTLSLGVFVAVLAITFSGIHSAEIIEDDLQVEGSIQALKADSIGEECHSGHTIHSGDICARDDLMAADNCLVKNGVYADIVHATTTCTCPHTHSRSMVARTYHIDTSESADMSVQDAGQRSAAIDTLKRLEIKSAGQVLGLSAPDVKQVAPNMVSEDEPDERPAVDMTQLLYTHLSVTQELIKKVEALEEAATRNRGLMAP
ncbi:unnamed protein product [Vitrella brassicaformis CCMP3155]|uniref:Peptidase S74 domain-containing protein n=1 Tax=Vitrella brassicaformis (strain CCMP3155) TaxID=1169540 RepID=A0A0G4EBC8_VITBC|nr:unnamed protein product [Vitrella brassicaformis CCMP3155]|eukprot:CEL92567.1 unnamed protein product [Vitrella brassicaformis CCMP3155]